MPVFLLCALLSSAARAADGAPAQGEAVVRKVVIQGNKYLETETIRSRLLTIEGSVFNPDTVSEDIRALYRLGYFEDIQVGAEGFEGGLAVTFTVKEKPLLSRFEFRGNKEVKTEDLKQKVDLKTNAVVNEHEIKLNAGRLLSVLHEKGFYQGRVDYRLEPITEREMLLAFVITEGKRIYVEKIDIVGAKDFTPDQIRDVMTTKEKGFFSFFTGSGTLVSQQLEDDVLRIISFMYGSGYIKVQVDKPKVEIDEAKEEIRITITLQEGMRYSVGEITAPGDDLFTPDQILAVTETRSGKVFRGNVWAKDLNAITTLYTEQGYAFCRVDSTTEPDDEKKTVNLRILVNRGAKVRVGRISVTGNTTTRDNVIRREMALQEGDNFNSRLLAKSKQRIMNLGFFDKVDITTEARGPEIVDLNVSVAEQNTGMISFGVGYSSQNKLGGLFSIKERNLFGWGHEINGSVDYSATARQFNLYYSNPSVWDSPYNYVLRAFNTTYEYTEYDKKSTGGSLTVGRGLGEFIRGQIAYSDVEDIVKNVDEEASGFIKSQAGDYRTRGLALILTRDTRDNFFYPTKGISSRLRFEYNGGFLGGDNSFTRSEIESKFFFPLFWDFVLSLNVELGYLKGFGGHEVPIYEHYFMGGIGSIHGYKWRSVGPKDENGDPIGGYTSLLGNAEILFPLLKEQRIMGFVAYDAGMVYDSGESVALGTLKKGIGYGIRWLSPIAPLRFEWGYALNPDSGEPKSDFQFSIGMAY